MRSGIAIPLTEGDERGHTPYATLTEDELRRKILNGEIKREDLPIQTRDRYREELKKARRY